MIKLIKKINLLENRFTKKLTMAYLLLMKRVLLTWYIALCNQRGEAMFEPLNTNSSFPDITQKV